LIARHGCALGFQSQLQRRVVFAGKILQGLMSLHVGHFTFRRVVIDDFALFHRPFAFGHNRR